jgi:hypothetical protein
MEIIPLGSFGRGGGRAIRLMQGEGSIAARFAHACVYRRALIAEVFDQVESKHIAVETDSAIHVFQPFPVRIQSALFPNRSTSWIKVSALGPSFPRSIFESCPWLIPRNAASSS